MSELRTNRIVPRDGLPSGSSGGIIQIKSTTKTDTFTGNTTSSFADITGFSVSITPTRSDSKIFVMVCVNWSNAGSGGNRVSFRLVRNSTPIAVGDSSGNRVQATGGGENSGGGGNMKAVTVNHLDDPSTTSAVTYKVQYIANDGAEFYLNRSSADSNTTGYVRTVSSISVMEVSG